MLEEIEQFIELGKFNFFFRKLEFLINFYDLFLLIFNFMIFN
jgi:hypothetical protein